MQENRGTSLQNPFLAMAIAMAHRSWRDRLVYVTLKLIWVNIWSNKIMLEQTREFVFIMLKPAAAKNKILSDFIKEKLLRYGDIKYDRRFVIVDKRRIADHYKSAKSSLWYPLLINYLSNKAVEHFILEVNRDKHNSFISSPEYSFADFLRKQVIGPANIFKTKEFHIRRLALRIHSGFLLDNFIHCSANTKEALDEIRIWYKDYPSVIEEFETKALNLHKYVSRAL